MNKNAGCTLAAVGAAIILLLVFLIGYPQYRVYSQRLAGEAALAEAQSSRQVAILEARAKKKAPSRSPMLRLFVPRALLRLTLSCRTALVAPRGICAIFKFRRSKGPRPA